MHFIKVALLIASFAFLSTLPVSTLSFAAPSMQNGMYEVPSDKDFATVQKNVVAFIQSKGLTLFAEFDHAKNARDVKLELKPTTVIVFGSPAVGTKLMQSFPGIGMDLPLKVLISVNKDNKVVVGYQDLATVFAPYGVAKDNPILQKMQGLLQALAQQSTK